MKLICVLIILALSVFSLGVAAAKHGESRGKWNFGVEFIGFIISMALYYFAGLFDIFFK